MRSPATWSSSAPVICWVLILCSADGPPEPAVGRKPGPSRSSAVRFRAGRGRIIATPATTMATRPGHFTRRRGGHPLFPSVAGGDDPLADRPADWDHNGGDGPFNDKRLARVVFTTSLETAVATRWIEDRSTLVRAAEAGARPGRGWVLAARGRGRDGLAGDLRPPAGDIPGPQFAVLGRQRPVPRRHRARRRLALEPGDSHDRRRLGVPAGRRESSAPAGNAPHTGGASTCCARGQSNDGGWGPRTSSPPEPFDTALALLALAKCDQSARSPRHDRPRPGVPDRPATGRRKLDRDDPACRQRQLCPADLDHRLGDTRPAGNARTVSARSHRSRNGSATVLLVTRREIGPATSTSNGCATLFPARSSSSVPTTRR